ncbi:MAG: Tim44-like domain-containing protein [Proteobacteria bacterium]|nr:Tim44-like domain-containing protein [Pseudomonadota bacterium]
MINRIHFNRICLTIAALFAVIFLYSMEGQGRVGGGESYKPSSSNGSSSSSRSHSDDRSSGSTSSQDTYKSQARKSSGGYTSEPLSWPSFFGLLATIAAIFIVPYYIYSRFFSDRVAPGMGAALSSKIDFEKVRAESAATKHQPKHHQKQVNSVKPIDQLLKSDPGFVQKDFSLRVSKAFEHLQQAWSKQDLSSSTAYLSDGMYERLKLQIEDQKSNGIRNELKNIQIKKCSVSDYESDGTYESLTMRIAASGTDQTIESATLKQTKSEQTNFEEFWTFTRHKDCKTNLNSGLLENCCPGCSTTISSSRIAKCPSCQIAMRSGTFDWVLTEISQSSTTSIETDRSSIEELLARDKSFSIQLLEDRASVVFLRLATARGRPESKRLKTIVEANRESIFSTGEPLSSIAIGNIELKKIDSKQDPVKDFAHLRIEWSAKFGSNRSAESRQSNLVLVRSKSATSAKSQLFGADHCSGCGASSDDLSTELCAYCQTPRFDADNQWVLQSFEKKGLLNSDDLKESAA